MVSIAKAALDALLNLTKEQERSLTNLQYSNPSNDRKIFVTSSSVGALDIVTKSLERGGLSSGSLDWILLERDPFASAIITLKKRDDYNLWNKE